VLLWGRNPEQMARTQAARENTDYLPGFPLPASLRISADLDAAVAHVSNALRNRPRC
jgi:glycerol-3-phosphate dehydrogenase (NAD(P)+)